MEADRLVGIVAVVVVPVEQRAGRFRGQLQGVHADHAADIHFAGARHQVVAHHAHHRAGHHAEVLFERRPALHGADGPLRSRHPAVDHRAQLGHLHERRRERRPWKHSSDGGQLGLRGRVVSFMRLMRPRISERSIGLDGDAAGFQNLLAVAHGVERRRPRADGADAQPAGPSPRGRRRRTTPDPSEKLGIGRFGVQRGQRVRNAVLRRLLQADILPQKLSRRSRSSSCRAYRAWPAPAPARSGPPSAACRRWRARRRNSAA
jgi:hypothetical protein